jgi:transposase
LTDTAWAKIAPLLPASGKPGGRWRRDGTWDQLLALAPTKSDAVGEVEWTVSVDAGVVRAHQHAAGARKRPARAEAKGRADAQDEALGHGRGGLTTKLHLAVDGKGRPLAVTLTPGQRHESTQLARLLDATSVPRPGGQGRPRKRPDHLLADRGYGHPACRRLLRRRGIAHTIPTRVDQRGRAGRPGSTGNASGSATWSSGAGTASSSARHRHPVRRAGGRLPRRRGHRQPHPVAGMTLPRRCRLARAERTRKAGLGGTQPSCWAWPRSSRLAACPMMRPSARRYQWVWEAAKDRPLEANTWATRPSGP